VVIEATGNASSVAEVLAPHVDRVVIANPKQARMIAHAKIKTDAIDAAVLAKLYAAGFLPEVWIPDPRTLALRRQVARRTQLVRQRVRLKNLIQSILHAHLTSCGSACKKGSGAKLVQSKRHVATRRARSRSRFARPYICRLTSFSLVT